MSTCQALWPTHCGYGLVGGVLPWVHPRGCRVQYLSARVGAWTIRFVWSAWSFRLLTIFRSPRKSVFNDSYLEGNHIKTRKSPKSEHGSEKKHLWHNLTPYILGRKRPSRAIPERNFELNDHPPRTKDGLDRGWVRGVCPRAPPRLCRIQYLSEGVEGWFNGIFRLAWSFQCLDGPSGRFWALPGFSGLE